MTTLAGSSTLFGTRLNGSYSPNFAVSWIEVVAAASGTAATMYIEKDDDADTGNALTLGIFDTSGNLLAATSSIACTAFTAEQVSGSLSVAISSGTSYRLACMFNGPYGCYRTSAAGTSYRSSTATYGTWPSLATNVSGTGTGLMTIWVEDAGGSPLALPKIMQQTVLIAAAASQIKNRRHFLMGGGAVLLDRVLK